MTGLIRAQQTATANQQNVSIRAQQTANGQPAKFYRNNRQGAAVTSFRDVFGVAPSDLYISRLIRWLALAHASNTEEPRSNAGDRMHVHAPKTAKDDTGRKSVNWRTTRCIYERVIHNSARSVIFSTNRRQQRIEIFYGRVFFASKRTRRGYIFERRQTGAQ